MDFATALGIGVLAGIGVAMPLGAIGVLLVREGATRGWAGSMPAAAAVATVDVLYCVVAVAAGSAIAPVVAAWSPWPQLVGGAALLAIAVRGLLAARHQVGDGPDPRPGRAGGWRRYAVFFGLTAINPATLLYFAALAAGLGAVMASAATAAAFAAGAGAASLGWQLVLVASGALLGATSGGRLKRWTPVVGSGVVGALGVLMLVGALL